jgi:uncharacterized protein
MKKKGNIVWFEIPVTDLGRAIIFYTNVFGLKIERKKFGLIDYGFFDPAETDFAGCLARRDDLIPGNGNGTQFFFYVTDIHSAIERSIASGGKLIKGKSLIRQADEAGKMFVPKTSIDNQSGYVAEITDSEGNRIALYANS